MPKIYLELASISKNPSSNFRGFTVYTSNWPCVFLSIFCKAISSISIPFAFLNSISVKVTTKAFFIKLYSGGFDKHSYPRFQKLQEFELDGEITFDTLANRDDAHAGQVLFQPNGVHVNKCFV